MVSAQGQLRISTDGHIKFTSEIITFEGVYAQPVPRDFDVRATATFEREGPYDLEGDLGTFGVNVRLSGPVGNGTINGDRVPTGLIIIRGSGNVTIKRD